jgi:hypothetical protein
MEVLVNAFPQKNKNRTSANIVANRLFPKRYFFQNIGH